MHAAAVMPIRRGIALAATMGCPMCSGEDASEVGRVPARDLACGYRRSLKVDVSAEIPPDVHEIGLLHCGRCDLKWYTPQCAGSKRFYEALQQHPWYYQDDKPEYEFARQHVEPDSRVLEVGCGKGAFRKFLPASVVYRGLEFNEMAVESARKAGLDVVVRSLDLESAERNDHYDVVCHFQVLEHVTDPRHFLELCVAALRPGGKRIVAVPAEDSFLCVAESTWLNMPPHHLTRWTDQALQRACQGLGVSVVDVWHEPVAPYHRVWHENVMMAYGAKRFAGRRTELIQGPLLARALHVLGKVPLVRNLFVARGKRDCKQSDRGHTLCMVGVKD